MSRTRSQRFEFDALTIDPQADEPLYRQLESQLRDAIRDARLKPGERLPSTRALATRLAVARNTISGAYDQLLLEGYLETHVGSGTRVARQLPDEAFTVPSSTSANLEPRQPVGRIAKRGEALGDMSTLLRELNRPAVPFRPHVPALDQFPRPIWQRLTENRLKRMPRSLLGSLEPLGYLPLREAIAEYVGIARGVRCSADQVVVTAGAQQGIDLLSRVLIDPGNRVWMEQPGYRPAAVVFRLAGGKIVPVPVDAEGIQVDAGQTLSSDARLAYVTPSSHWPLEVTMSLERRHALLNWATQNRAWIIEDDYNGEFRYSARPLPAMQGLDTHGCVIYMGTFSKVLFPALRLGFLIVPPVLIEPLMAARWLADRHSPPFEQLVLTDFINEGHFARHIRRMRTLYASRRDILCETVAQQFGSQMRIAERDVGMHVVAYGENNAIEQRLRESAVRAKIDFHRVADYSMEDNDIPGIILGFAGYAEDQTQHAVARWAEIYHQMH